VETVDCVLVMPTYNEEAVIAAVLSEWTEELEKQVSGSFRIVVVNDGSRDSTGSILDQLALREARLRVIHQKNGGHGAAVLTAYRAAVDLPARYVFQVDSDDQFPPEDFALLWRERERSDFILGVRSERHDPPHRLLISRFLRWLLFGLYGVRIEDANVPFRLIEASYLRRLLAVLPEDVFAPNIFLSVLAASRNGGLISVPVRHRERTGGKVSIIGWRLIRACMRCVKELVAFRTSLPTRLSRLRGCST
jgi:glycosyltransferase involved in cell wall biosynthesis